MRTHPGPPSPLERESDPSVHVGRHRKGEAVIRLLFFVALFPLVLVLLWDDAPQWAILGAWIVGAA